MKHVGVDFHKHLIVLCVVKVVAGRRRVIRRRRFSCRNVLAIRALFSSLGRFQVAVEATAGYDWLFELIEDLADRLVVANTKKLRVIAESARKSDRIDAETLAMLLAADMLPEAYRPAPRVRELRVLVRHRCWLRRRASTVKCKLRSTLARYNADAADVCTAQAAARLAALPLAKCDGFVIAAWREQWGLLERQIAAADGELRRFAAAAPAPERDARKLLADIPQVGPLTTAVVLSELGDWRRFRSQKAVVAFAGLDPGMRRSVARQRNLPLTKHGSRLLRWVLIQAAWRLVRHEPTWQAAYDRLRGNTGSKKKAIVAVARRLLCVMFAVLRSGQPYSAR